MVVAVACISTFVLVILIGSYVVYLWSKKEAQNGESVNKAFHKYIEKFPTT